MKNENRKRPLAVRILLIPLKIILIVLAIILIWFIFCRFDRVSSVNALPPDYAIYLRTDKVYDTIDPLLDLDATLIAMTSPALQQYREQYLSIKQSKLRKNFFVKHALKRRLDVAVYQQDEESDMNFVAVVDSGFLAGAVRLVPFILPRINSLSQKLELCSNAEGSFYKFQETGYICIKKNLIVFSSDRDFMSDIMTFENSKLYQAEALDTMNSKLKNPLRILADSNNLVNLIPTEGTAKDYMDYVVKCLSKDEYAVLNFGITEQELNVSINLPLDIDEKNAEHPVVKLLQKESKVPTLLPRFSDEVQYYTLINAGQILELKDAALKVLPPEKNFESLWKKGDASTKLLFNQSLNDILGSWTSDEFAVFGIEGKSEPVFAIKISDEAKRKVIFDSIFSTAMLNENDSLLLDGIRLPCFELPGYLLSILQALNINVPKPYYFVKDDFIYLSQSPENLIAINAVSNKATRLSASENWKRVSSKQTPYSSLSLYYNLERSIPFFIKGNSAVSKILALYTSGRFDVTIKDNTLSLQLQASSLVPEASNHIPGYPVKLENKTNAQLVKSNAKKSNLVFWLENGNTIKSMDYLTFAQNQKDFSDIKYLTAASENTAKNTGGELWAATSSGVIYLLDSKLEVVPGYPVLTGAMLSCEPFNYKDSLGLADNDGQLLFVNDSTGEITTLDTDIESAIKSAPVVSGDYIAFYEKGFMGGIHVYKNQELVTNDFPLELDGIAYESPCLFSEGGKNYAAMITQSGLLYVYDLSNTYEPVNNFPKQLDGLFYVNVKSANGNLFALSSTGELYKVTVQGDVIRVRIPYFTAKTGRITVTDYDGDGKEDLFITGEGNSLYGFNDGLELLPVFPISGYGNPVFTDLNGDNKKDCLVITFDNTISAANVLK